jgi:hypothetical protein
VKRLSGIETEIHALRIKVAIGPIGKERPPNLHLLQFATRSLSNGTPDLPMAGATVRRERRWIPVGRTPARHWLAPASLPTALSDGRAKPAVAYLQRPWKRSQCEREV